MARYPFGESLGLRIAVGRPSKIGVVLIVSESTLLFQISELSQPIWNTFLLVLNT